MGRVKLQIKRIENTTNRQVTFSKRRNGLVKKAYELSILCNVDVALIMFSPSGRVSLFSGNNKSIEEVMMRYVNLPEHERGRMHNQEFLQRVLSKFKADQDITSYQATCSSHAATDSRIEDLQRDIDKFRSRIEDLENQLRIYQGNFSHTTTLREAESQELVLQDALTRLRKRKLVLKEEHGRSSRSNPATPQILECLPQKPAGVNLLEWMSQGDPQVQIINFADANELLTLSSRNPTQHLAEIFPSPSSPLHGQHPNFDEQMSINGDMAKQNNLQHLEYGQFDNVNLTPWPEFYQPGTSISCNIPHQRERALLELYLSQFHPQQF